MSIKQAQQKLEDSRNNRAATQTRELWLKENDQVYVTSLYSGNEEGSSPYFSLFFSRNETIKYDTGKEYVKKLFLAENEEDVPEQYKRESRSQLGLWVFVHFILHETNMVSGKIQENWKEEKSASGVVRYKEEVNDYKLYLGGLGKDQSFWNQLVDIYNEEGSLDKKTLRIGKRGKGINTFYSIATAPGKVLMIPKEKVDESKELQSVLEYVKVHLVLTPVVTSKEVVSVETVEEENDDESLF